MNTAQKQRLVQLLGPDSVSTTLIERLQYAHDMAPVPQVLGLFWKTIPEAVVRPSSLEQIITLMEFASKYKIALVPRGRATTMMGGAYPSLGGISVDMTSHKGIVSFDESTLSVKVKSGTTWDSVLTFLEKRGYTLCCYPTSAPSATVGGWLANGGIGLGRGALGIGSSQYGYAADTVLDLSVVLPDGSYIGSAAESFFEVKDFVGSEGILGIFDTVTLKLRPLPPRQAVFCFNFSDIQKLCSAAVKCTPLKPFFLLIEDENMLDFKRKAELHVPSAQNLLTVVLEGEEKPLELKIQTLRMIVSTHGGQELPQDVAQEEWKLRYYPMRHKKAGPNLLGGEFTAPVNQLAEVIKDIQKLAADKKITIAIHGTLGVQEVLFMPQVLSDERKKFRYLTMMSLVKNLNDLSVKLGGVPYGAGLFNSFYAKQIHGTKFSELLRLKKELDPRRIMNPGKAIHCLTRFKIALPKFAYGIGMIMLGLFVKHGK